MKRWYLHAMEQPEGVDGQLKADRSVHPQGHFVAAGQTLRASHGGSALFCKTLLPRNATIRVLGGKGHQFEVAGENYDMYDTWWQKVGTPAYQEEIGIGGWRVEVEPPAPQPEDIFLHVLWAADDTAQTMCPVETIEEASQAGARFAVNGVEVKVTFATTGDVGGHITLLQNGKSIDDRPLANGVEDSYQKWSSDPRFQARMTNPYMRAGIGDTRSR